MIKLNHPKMDEFKAHLQNNFFKAQSDREEKTDRFQDSFLYYTCKKPYKDEREVSGYVEPVLRKAVEAVKPSLMRVFTENERNAVTFRPSSLVSTEVAKAVDDYINNIFLRDNDGYDIVERVITEALVTGDAFLKYFVEEDVIVEDVELDNAPADIFAALIADFPDTDPKELENLTEDENGISGKVELKRVDKKVKVEYIPFSDIFVNDDAEDIRDTRYICHRITKTAGELIELGYDKAMIEKASKPTTSDNYLSLKSLINNGTFGDDDEDDRSLDHMEQNVDLFEHYIYTSFFNKKGKVELVKAYSTHCDVLSVEVVNRIPIVHGMVERIPGSFWGVSFYDKFKSVQDLMSRMFRTKEAASMLGTYGRYIAVKGQYSRESLLNSQRPGGVIEESTPGAVRNFYNGESIAAAGSLDSLMTHLLGSSKEEVATAAGVDVTGANMSATAAAITANSADMKDKVIARVLAYTLFQPLFSGIYELIRDEDLSFGEIENPQYRMAQEQMASIQDPAIQQQLASIPKTIPLNGGSLPKRHEFNIDVHTANDDAMEAQQLLMCAQTFTQLEQIPSQFMTDQARYNIISKVTGLTVEEIQDIFPPKQVTPEEQMISQQAQIDQLEMATLQKELLKAQVHGAALSAAKTEQEMLEMVKDGEHKREIEKEKIAIEAQKMVLKEQELAAEIEQNRKITVGRYD